MRREMREQMPGWLKWVDDPLGIAWRASGLLRRFSFRRALRFSAAMAIGKNHEKPILIVGMPRSGTTFLAHVLRASSTLGSLPWEGHDIWRMFHHPRYQEWESDYVGEGAIRPAERRFVNACLYAHAGGRRVVEKTADNLVRIPYLLELFPDAHFVVIKRNPCDVINSYINGWRHPRNLFRSYFVPRELSIPGYPHRRQWCSTLIRGWRELSGEPIHEIAYNQWAQYVDCIEQGRRIVPRGQWFEIHFETLIRQPDAAFAQLCDVLGVAHEEAIRATFDELRANPVNSLSAAAENKWKTQNGEEIRALLPRIASVAVKIGYQVDPVGGEVHGPQGVETSGR